jgi:2-phospho-L-lactate guanylyltransferase
VSAAVIIPLRSLRDGKGRLEAVLDAHQRRTLTEALFRTVVAGASPLPAIVVTGDGAAADIAEELGATVVPDPRLGLIGAVDAGVAAARRWGYERVVVAHADLPFPDGLVDLADPGSVADIVLVPDRHLDGTNVISVGVHREFRFHYGVGSFERHVAEARRLGVEPTIVTDTRLAWDVDLLPDLTTPPEWGPPPWETPR